METLFTDVGENGRVGRGGSGNKKYSRSVHHEGELRVGPELQGDQESGWVADKWTLTKPVSMLQN